MRSQLKDLIELTSIEVAFARAELAMMSRLSEENARIATHLGSAEGNLIALLAELEKSDTPRRPRKRVA